VGFFGGTMRQIALALFALCLAAVLGVLDVSVLIASSENVTQQIKNEKIIENATGINSNDANKTDKDDTLIKWYKNKLSNWERLASVLRFLQIALAGIAISSSIFVSSKLKTPKWCPEGLAPFIAAVSIALLMGFNLNSKANSVRAGCLTLEVAIREYKETEEKKIGNVRRAYKRAEASIGEYTVSWGESLGFNRATPK